MEDALELLSTVGQVSVAREEIGNNNNNNNGFRWRVTFLTTVGDVTAMYADGNFLPTEATPDAAIVVYDGDNALDTNGAKAHASEIGEEPVEYHAYFAGPDDREYTIPGLTTGTEYLVYVSASNLYGTSPRTTTTTTGASSSLLGVAPPSQIPGKPNDVDVSVLYDDANRLTVSYASPDSDGGSDIFTYRIELDTSEDFTNPVVRQDHHCPVHNMRTVYEVKAHPGQAITSGYFTLDVTVHGFTYTTDPIPYDAVAMQRDETGIEEELDFTLTVQNNSGMVTPSARAQGKLFDNDRIKIQGSRHENQVFTVSGIDFIEKFNLSEAFVDSGEYAALSGRAVYRVHGGRGGQTESKVFCELDTFCDEDRVRTSGSMQAKLETIDDAFTNGVNVIRTGPSNKNEYTWSVTFLDDALYTLGLGESNIVSNNTDDGDVVVTRIKEGELYEDCTGAKEVPTEGGLVTGQYYYARVTALNAIGYSLSQTAPSPEKPMVVPGRPTSCTVSVFSSSSLKVFFSPPTSDGGDDITAYLVEWAESSYFTDAESATVIYLAGGAPFYKTITGLTQGTYYYVRVSARNAQGYGLPQVTTPTHLNPYQTPGAPTNVALGVTSDSMLTVAFDEPTDLGGDALIYYLVEWDTSATFASLSALPHKGEVSVDATSDRSYTIELLSENVVYYVRVSCINNAGQGLPTIASPASAFPTGQVPGVPHSINVAAGSADGTLDISWLYPSVPHHRIPCYGTVSSPEECPTPFGGTLAESTGGGAITEYEIQYNELSDFTGQDNGVVTTGDTFYTLNYLTPGRLYYIRVLARNSFGSGDYCTEDGLNCPSAGDALVGVAKE